MNVTSTAELEIRVRDCLRQIHDPCSIATGHPLHLEEMGLIKSIVVDADAARVVVDIRLTSPSCTMVGYFVTEIQELVVAAAPEIRDVEVLFDHGLDWAPDMMSEEVRQARAVRFAARSLRAR
jgi:metal-sulfur cluster biosynthetic enzyme